MTEEDLAILEELIKGDKECLEMDIRVNPNDEEDIDHWRKEIRAIENTINSYNKEKARADKLEIEYSRMLTKLDEYEVNNIEQDKTIDSLTEEIEKKDKQIDLMAKQIKEDGLRVGDKCFHDRDVCDKYEKCEDCIKEYFKKKVED